MVYFEDSPDFCDSDTLAKYNFEGKLAAHINFLAESKNIFPFLPPSAKRCRQLILKKISE